MHYGCFRCGLCCSVFDIEITHQELEILQTHDSSDLLDLSQLFDGHYTINSPCPFYQSGKCSVYEIRPAHCRNFLCGRTSPRQRMPTRSQKETIVLDEEFQRVYQPMRQDALRWANQHGW